MHDVTLHFGDLQRDWAKFPNAAWGMGFKLLMKYYDQEAPLSDDPEELEYIADATTDEDRRLLQMVLKRAFVHDPMAKVYHQRRADKELAAYQQRCDAAALSNVKKEAKRWPAKWPENIQELTLEQFLDQRSDYQDPVTKRLRYSPTRSRSAPFGSVSEAPGSVSAPLRPSKSPFPGNHSPTFPPSHSATLPDTPIVPQGDGSVSPPAVGSDESSRAQGTDNTTALTEPPDSAKKNKGGAGRKAAQEIYAAYPKKVGREAALKAIEKRLAQGLEPVVLLATVKAYALAVARWPESERRFVPHPATWFNEGRYDDDVLTWQRTATTGSESLFGKKEGGGAVNAVGAVIMPTPCSEWRWFAREALGLNLPDHMLWEQVPQNRREQIIKAYADHKKATGGGGDK